MLLVEEVILTWNSTLHVGARVTKPSPSFRCISTFISSPVSPVPYRLALQRSVQEIYRRGEYDEALTLAQHALVEFSDYFGKDHPVVASMHNNVPPSPV